MAYTSARKWLPETDDCQSTFQVSAESPCCGAPGQVLTRSQAVVEIRRVPPPPRIDFPAGQVAVTSTSVGAFVSSTRWWTTSYPLSGCGFGALAAGSTGEPDRADRRGDRDRSETKVPVPSLHGV